MERDAITHADSESVVLLDDAGAAIGSMPKAAAHHARTPLHLAFSCYVFTEDGHFLTTQRALTKRVFPGVWTNSLCGHPAPGESAEAAARRRARDELGMELPEPRLVLPAFAYRAEMEGIVEYERCPVFMSVVGDRRCTRNADEVEAVEWVPWQVFVREVRAGSRRVSPWCVEQVRALTALGAKPLDWPTGDPELLPPALRFMD